VQQTTEVVVLEPSAKTPLAASVVLPVLQDLAGMEINVQVSLRLIMSVASVHITMPIL